MKSGLVVLAAAVLSAVCPVALRADIFVRNARADIIYQYSNGVMYSGSAAKNGKRIFKYDPRLGTINRMDGRVIATWKKDTLQKGGRPWYVLDGVKLYRRSRNSKAVGRIEGRKIYRGSGPSAKLILYPDAPLPMPVAVYLFHVATDDDAPAASGEKSAGNGEKSKPRVDVKTVPFGYYLGEPGQGRIVLSLRGDTIYYGSDLKEVAYTRRGLAFYKAGNSGLPDFRMDRQGNLYKGDAADPKRLVMRLDWFNCYAAGKRGPDAIGTLQYTGKNILTEGYTEPSEHPDFTGKRVLLSSTLPNDKVDMALRVFLIYLTQLDPEFREHVRNLK